MTGFDPAAFRAELRRESYRQPDTRSTPMTEPLTPRCPLCDCEPMMILGGGTQAFCGNDDGCRLLTWDPTLSADANLANASEVDWPAEGSSDE
jgi:hypothetical protein